MEPRPWNNIKIALKKDTLSSEELGAHMDAEHIKGIVAKNAMEAKQLLHSFEGLDEEVVKFFEQKGSSDGSVDISGLDLKSDFFQLPETCIVSGGVLRTRGYNYISSLDASLTSVQKITKCKEVFTKTVDALKDESLSKLEKLLLLDYLKNSIVTILNSFLYQEKLGSEYADTSEEHQEIRAQMIAQVGSVIGASIDMLLDKNITQVSGIDFQALGETVDKAVHKLEDYHFEHRFPSFYVSRPEVTHPLIITGAALLFAKRYSMVETVVGFPSGGTEIAFTTKVFMDRLKGTTDTSLVLMPISLHTLKNASNGMKQATIDARPYLQGTAGPILICDDNASSGRTLQFAHDLISEVDASRDVYCAVAEADIIRSNLDKDNGNRTHVISKDAYADSIAVLPVSKRLQPKVDLVEILEKKKILSYYKTMELKSSKEVDFVYARAMAHVNERGTDYRELDPEKSIASFRGTFLSNFYAVPVVLNGKNYPSVEHAYQGAKFEGFDWSSVSTDVKKEIREALRLRGYGAEIVYSEELFMDAKMAAGHAKIIADILRSHHLIASGWEDLRVKIMIELLLQKFKDPELASSLLNTGDKELIEGNTWDDKLWGVAEGNGRNILGSVLMEIREMLRKGKTE